VVNLVEYEQMKRRVSELERKLVDVSAAVFLGDGARRVYVAAYERLAAQLPVEVPASDVHAAAMAEVERMTDVSPYEPKLVVTTNRIGQCVEEVVRGGARVRIPGVMSSRIVADGAKTKLILEIDGDMCELIDGRVVAMTGRA
jgi:hypothetical protein